MERAKERQFGKLLMQWDKEKNRRSMPWKGEKDPYKIWLSEIILQQTRVEQGLDYYNRFVQQYHHNHNLIKHQKYRHHNQAGSRCIL